MTQDVAKEQVRQLKGQRESLLNTIADAQARVEVIDVQIAALEPLAAQKPKEDE